MQQSYTGMLHAIYAWLAGDLLCSASRHRNTNSRLSLMCTALPRQARPCRSTHISLFISMYGRLAVSAPWPLRACAIPSPYCRTKSIYAVPLNARCCAAANHIMQAACSLCSKPAVFRAHLAHTACNDGEVTVSVNQSTRSSCSRCRPFEESRRSISRYALGSYLHVLNMRESRPRS